jgi:DNA-binding beta-propeller fold protein YncE
MRFGTTIAGGCNGSASTNQTILKSPSDIGLGYHNTFYVGDGSNRLQAFEFNNRTGRVLKSFGYAFALLFVDNRTSNMYITVFAANLVYIWPTNPTIPLSGISHSNCSMNWVHAPSEITVHSVGNVYISSADRNRATKWAPNANNSIVIDGSSTGSTGSSSLSLNQAYGLALDESKSFLYVVDRYNHRIQRFILGGSGIGVTVAGGNGQGSAANQFYYPNDIYVSKSDGSLYIGDCDNNRIQQ